MAFSFPAKIGESFLECFDMEHGLALPISFRFHGVAGEATSFSFSKPEALVDSPKFPSRLAVEPSPFSPVQSTLPIDMGGGCRIIHAG